MITIKASSATVHMNLVQSVCLLLHQSKMVEIQLTPATRLNQPLLVEPQPAPLLCDVSLEIDLVLFKTTAEGMPTVVVSISSRQAY